MTTNSERLLAVYARFAQALAGIPEPRAQALHQLAAGVPHFVAEARLRAPKPGEAQVAAGLEQALRELPDVIAEVEDPWRAAVSRALHEALTCECPELLSVQAQRLAQIVARGRITTDAEHNAVQHRIDVLEGEPELGEELRDLYALLHLHR